LPLKDDLDNNGIQFLQSLVILRDYISSELNIYIPTNINYLNKNKKHCKIEYILIEIARATLSIADFQLEEGELDMDIDRSEFRNSAASNFHTCCLFYRIIESIHSIYSFKDRLAYCISRSRQLSSLYSNTVGEHFSGSIFKNSYLISGQDSKLGEGSYGTVYQTKHKRTNDMRATKVFYVTHKFTPYLIKKLHNEINILKNIDHPNILKIHGKF
jgi:hypothetical protein